MGFSSVTETADQPIGAVPPPPAPLAGATFLACHRSTDAAAPDDLLVDLGIPAADPAAGAPIFAHVIEAADPGDGTDLLNQFADGQSMKDAIAAGFASTPGVTGSTLALIASNAGTTVTSTIPNGLTDKAENARLKLCLEYA